MSRSEKILKLLNISLKENDANKEDDKMPRINKTLGDNVMLTEVKLPLVLQSPSNNVIDQERIVTMISESYYVDPASGILVSDVENVAGDQDVEIVQSSSSFTEEVPTSVLPNMTEVESNSSDIVLVDNRKMNVSLSKSHCKKYFCIYCNKLITNFGRHLISLHNDKKEVADILIFPKGHPERHKKISYLRRQAQFKYNTDTDVNGGTIIVKRRPSSSKNRSASHYVPCSHCKEMYSKLSLRAHVLKCNPLRVQGERNVLLQSRRFQMNVNKKANTRLARDILSRCKDDIITSILLFDDLCILYGNKLTKRYRLDQDTNMIRTRLREIGRFIQEFKKINSSVHDLRDILDPAYYDQIIEAINKVAGLDEDLGRYKAPSTAYNLGLHIKSIALLLETQCIKEKDLEKRESVRDLLCLIREGFRTDINRTVAENQTENKRHKKIKLPTAEDIIALKNYLKNGLRDAFDTLKKKFSTKDWKNLAGYTLISLQLFNRRRAGELERISIEDYKTYEFVNQDDDVFKGLCETDKSIAKHYARFFIRGKLNRQVPVIISKEFISYIEMILKYREEYGVSNTNPYVFGTASKMHNTYLRACILMRNYSKACGAPNPDSLRGTELRKQIATACALYNLSDPLVEDIANHLGHHVNIHKKIYRQSTAREVPAITQILLKALGENEEEDPENESPNVSILGIQNNSLDTSRVVELENNLNNSQNLNISNCSGHAEESNLFRTPVAQKSGVPPKTSVDHISVPTGDNWMKFGRISWTTPEKQAVRNEFSFMIESGIVPTYAECIELREKNDCLRNRTPPQIKSFIAHESKKLRTPKVKKTGKRTWTTPERKIVRTEFREHLEKRNLPSLSKCKNVIASNPQLNNRTPQVLKAYINNLNRKAQRDS